MTHPDEPLWRELEAEAGRWDYKAETAWNNGLRKMCEEFAIDAREEATHALRREAPITTVGILEKSAQLIAREERIFAADLTPTNKQVLDAQWRLRDRDQDERQRQREAGR